MCWGFGGGGWGGKKREERGRECINVCINGWKGKRVEG